MKTKKQVQQENIERHVKNLATLLSVSFEEAVIINKKLRRLENKIHAIYLIAFERENTPAEIEAKERAKEQVVKLLPNVKGLFFNSDARGYSIKIDDEVMRSEKIQLHKDMGGYGILSPEY